MKFLKIIFILTIIFSLFFVCLIFQDYSLIKNSYNKQPNIFDIESITVLTGSKGRIKEALNFIHLPNVKYIIISGANPNSSKKNILSSYKKHKKFFNKVIIENLSTNTIENAFEVKKILKMKKIQNTLLITSATHMQRAKYIFKKVFYHEPIDIYFLPVNERLTLKKILKERVKFMFDFIKLMF